ncbi:MAG: hypothetical protein PHG99_01830 [Erysipelotrichaceae bacterium]|nr:hypothetical protein [Erysipelotrichaceae bacterium]MDD4642231.1 hypothetical protein [Erysipelotrichaceae bacterium]
MIVIFGYIVAFVIIASQFYRLKKFNDFITENKLDGNPLDYKESSWAWYISQASLAILFLILNFISNDNTEKAMFIVLTAMFLANVILGITFKRIYYNDNGFVYQQRYIFFDDLESIEKLNSSRRTYAITLKNEEVLYMEKKRALLIEDIYNKKK